MRTWKLVWIGMLVTAASCVQILDGDHPYSVEGEPAAEQPCESAANCDDDNDCTTDTCSDEKICVYTPRADGPNPAQTVGDCQRIDCAAGKEVTVTDNADIPDDNEPCTADVCTAGTPSNTALPDGNVCKVGTGSGQCQMGVCQIACDPQPPCDDQNPCTSDVCDTTTRLCVFMNLDGVPTPGVAQTPGDCKERRCANGDDVVALDDADPEDDANPCTKDVCEGGLTEHIPGTSESACPTQNSPTGMGTCDGSTGACLGCLVTADCGSLEYTCGQNICFSCQDAAKNGTETDVDCGGECLDRCVRGDTCIVTADCEGECDNGICVDCFDGMKNGTEGYVDCGGTCVIKCSTGAGCNKNADCFNSVCTNGTCQAPTCTDGAQNGSETDTDCGGPCSDCAAGKKCNDNGDCINDCINGVCN